MGCNISNVVEPMDVERDCVGSQNLPYFPNARLSNPPLSEVRDEKFAIAFQSEEISIANVTLSNKNAKPPMSIMHVPTPPQCVTFPPNLRHSPRQSRQDQLLFGHPFPSPMRRGSNPLFICNNNSFNHDTTAPQNRESIPSPRRRSVLFTENPDQCPLSISNQLADLNPKRGESGSTNTTVISHPNELTISRNSHAHMSLASVSEADVSFGKESDQTETFMVEGVGSEFHSYASSQHVNSTGDLHALQKTLDWIGGREIVPNVEKAAMAQTGTTLPLLKGRHHTTQSSGGASFSPHSTFDKQNYSAVSPQSLILSFQPGLRTLSTTPATQNLQNSEDRSIRSGAQNTCPAMQQAQKRLRHRQAVHATELRGSVQEIGKSNTSLDDTSQLPQTLEIVDKKLFAVSISSPASSLASPLLKDGGGPQQSTGHRSTSTSQLRQASISPMQTSSAVVHSFVSVLPQQHALHFATHFPELHERLEASMVGQMPSGSPTPFSSPKGPSSPVPHARLDKRIRSSCFKKEAHQIPLRTEQSKTFAATHPLPHLRLHSPKIENIPHDDISSHPDPNRSLLPSVQVISLSSSSASSTGAFEDSDSSGESVIMAESGEDGFVCVDMLASMRQTIAERDGSACEVRRKRSIRRRNRPSISGDTQLGQI